MTALNDKREYERGNGEYSRKLLPCPFCGEANELYPAFHWPGTGMPYAVDCLGCGIDLVPRKGTDAIDAWNRRAEPKS
jgi:Lar family restriction alleviation protein